MLLCNLISLSSRATRYFTTELERSICVISSHSYMLNISKRMLDYDKVDPDLAKTSFNTNSILQY